VARTAVIAGTATAVSNRVSRRQAGRWAEQDQQQIAQQQQQPVYVQQAAPPPAPASQTDKLTQLRELGHLRDQGILTEAEFEAQKQQILAS
jgi:hypothetical protein